MAGQCRLSKRISISKLTATILQMHSTTWLKQVQKVPTRKEYEGFFPYTAKLPAIAYFRWLDNQRAI